MAAMRDAPGASPSALFQHRQCLQVFDQPVTERTVELQPVLVRAKTAVADQVTSVLHGEQVLTRREWFRVGGGHLCLRVKVQGVDRLLIPEAVSYTHLRAH